MQTVRQHQEGVRWTSTSKNFKIKKLTNILTSETILQSSQTSMVDHSCRNSQRLKVVAHFRRKFPPHDFLLGSKYASIPVMTYLSKIVRQHQKDGRWTST